MLTNSVLVREKAARKTLINQSDWWCRTICTGKCAPQDERDSQCPKVIRTHQAVLDGERLIRLIYFRPPFNVECTRMSAHGGWKLVSHPYGCHSGQGLNPFHDLRVKP